MGKIEKVIVVGDRSQPEASANESDKANNGIQTKSLRTFITKNKEAIMSSLNDVMKVSFKGLSLPHLYKSVCESMARLARRPKERQARLIAAAYEHLTTNRSLLINAEMSAGKTQMAVSLIDLLNAKRAGIMCPSHLVSKWAREIEIVFGKGDQAIRPYKIVTIGCGEWHSLDFYRDIRVKKGESLIFIFSYSAAKLGYRQRKVANRKETIRLIDQTNADGYKVPTRTICHTLVCPDCGEYLTEPNPNESVIDMELDRLPRKCPKCKTILRQPAQGEKRLSLAEYAGRRLPKGWFDLLIVDEIHEVKGGDTGQGSAFGTIASRSKKVVGLTGTLLNGYAESVFYVLYRLNPSLMKNRLGLEYKEASRFIDLYGAQEKRWSDIETNVEGVVTKKRGTPRVKSLPRINPLLLTQLLGTSIFLRLDELNIALPRYSEIVERVEPDRAVMGAYNEYIDSLISLIKSRSSEGMKKLGELAAASLAILGVPNKPRGDNIVCYNPPVARNETEQAITSASALLPITNKEQRLIEIVKEELAIGRKCLVYITFSRLGTTEAVESVLKQALPHRVIRSLPDNVEAKRREAWLRANPADILVVNPEKVKTGLDLLEYPTIVFFQPTYKVYTLKQAARRSWRIGQDKDVKVYFLVYRNTPEEKALQLIAKKLSTASVIEGRIGDGGLADCDDENIAVALAKSLIKREAIENFAMEEIALGFGLRESDPFERYYLDICKELDRRRQDKEAKALLSVKATTSESIQEAKPETPSKSETIVSLFNPSLSITVEALKREQAVKEEEAMEGSKNDENKIAIYRVITRGKKRVEQRLEITRDQIDELIAQEEIKASFQLAFDF